MTKKVFLLLLILNCSLVYAQTIKTDVLVIGDGASGVAAALQCARSKVKTILAAGSIKIEDEATVNGMAEIDANRNIPSGIWGEFRKQIQDIYKNTPGSDTSGNASLRFEPDTASSILKKMTDTVKNLSLYLNATFTAIKKDGDRWDVEITQDGKTITIKTMVVIDATENGEVAANAVAKFSAGFDNNKNEPGSKLYRTSIATGEALPGQKYGDANATRGNYPPYPFYCVPMNTVLFSNIDNLLITEKALPVGKSIQYLPLQFELGQGVGAMAAYCAFFKTTTKNLKVRIIQGELLDFKGYLVPFTDIKQTDPEWRAVQQVCATGLLKGERRIVDNNNQFVFMPDSLVTTAEIKPVLIEIYTRAFLWFIKEKPGEKFTLGNLLSFISDYTLTDPVVLKARIQKDWKSLYKFKPDFDLNHQVTRREFAILTNKYLNPFARTVDLSGRLMN
jgi:hypothetical protein